MGMVGGQVGGQNSSLAKVDPLCLQHQSTAKKTEASASLKEDPSDSHSKGRMGLRWPSLSLLHVVCELTTSIQNQSSGWSLQGQDPHKGSP